MTGPGWLGLKCVKTGSLITVFGNTSKNDGFLWVCFLSSFILICFVFLRGTCCYHAQRGISDNKIGEHGLLFSAANRSASFYEVVTVDDVLLCSCISLTWLHSV